MLELKVTGETASLKTTLILVFTEILLELSAGAIEIKLGLVVSTVVSARSSLEEETVVNF